MHNTNCSVSPQYFHETLASSAVQATSAIFQTISLITFFLGVPGNGLVLWVLGVRLKWTETTLLFLNLSLADFFYLLVVPLRVVYAARLFDWPFGLFLCKTDFFLAFVNMYASIFFLAAVSLDRCLLVVLPVRYRQHRSTRASLVACSVVWMMSITLSAPYIYFADNQILFNRSICFINYAPENSEAEVEGLRMWRELTMVLVRFFFAFCIPIVVIIACYIVIGLRVRRMRLANPTRVYRITLLTVLAFFINWTPYQLFTVGSLFLSSRRKCLFHPSVFLGYPVVYAFAYVNSCVNPILYVFVGGGFTRKLTQSLPAIFERAFNEDALSVTRRVTDKFSTLRTNTAQLRRDASAPTLSHNVHLAYEEEL